LVKAVIPRKPFHEEKIYRGQQRGLKKGFLSGIFGDDENTDSTGQISNIKEVGYFKGLIKVYNKNDKEKWDAMKKEKSDKIISLI
jgi:hypothetical protein